MRAHGVSKADAPGTVVEMARGLCVTCYDKHRDHTRSGPLEVDAPCVQVRTWLRPSTFRQLTGHAANRGLTLGELISKLADAALRPTEIPPERTAATSTGRKRRRSLTADERAQAQMMRDAGDTLATIAEYFDISVASASRHTSVRAA
ncbi:hypothetical protein [Microbacterium sp. KR10-403]|uniref:hypothetical protein n=1 Tax=Microbacterium sp. KR10-403 TaxID=3158581 RepID=UPI0032E4ABED